MMPSVCLLLQAELIVSQSQLLGMCFIAVSLWISKTLYHALRWIHDEEVLTGNIKNMSFITALLGNHRWHRFQRPMYKERPK